ncbi:MAG: hypothetical protein QOI39_618 [Mycobacterium sp.]|nr:hypothetical protein [Mycobacterium sp.]
MTAEPGETQRFWACLKPKPAKLFGIALPIFGNLDA